LYVQSIKNVKERRKFTNSQIPGPPPVTNISAHIQISNYTPYDPSRYLLFLFLMALGKSPIPSYPTRRRAQWAPISIAKLHTHLPLDLYPLPYPLPTSPSTSIINTHQTRKT
jgi:hypothetical protein